MDTALTDKVVLVTGGAGGIGSEICRAFQKEEAKVAIHYLSNQTEANKIALFGSSLAVKADLTKEQDVDHLFSEVESKLGPVEILIANAAISVEAHTPIHKMSLSQWENTLNTNLTSVFLCFRRFFTGIETFHLSHPAGVIIGSTAGLIGEAGHADYSASKSALTPGLLLSLKNEIVKLAPQGRINSVCPSWIKSPMAKSFIADSKAMKRVLQTVPLKKIGLPEDVAAAVVFLASSKLSGHISGHSIVVSGGMEGRIQFEPSEIIL